MAIYWHSINNMIAGNGGDAEPRRRSRFEPDQGDRQDLSIEVGDRDQERPGTIPAPAASGLDRESFETESSTSATTRSNTNDSVQESISRASSEPPAKIVVAEHSTDNKQTQPSDRHEGQNKQTASTPRDELDYSQLKGTPAIEPKISAFDQSPSRSIELEAAISIEPSRLDSAAKGETDDNRPVSDMREDGDPSQELASIAVSLSDLREDLNSMAQAEPLSVSEPEKPDNQTIPQEDRVQPVVVEIDHIEISITRPSAPSAGQTQKAQEPAKPLVSLNDYLNRSEGSAG